MSLEGSLAPKFSLPNQHNEVTSLSDFEGRSLVIFFYPRDNTSGCTKENIDFNESAQEFNQLGITLLGVSRDSVKSHANFANKQGLSHSLLSDTEEAMCQAYGVMVQKSMYGRQYMGIDRSTFLINGQGIVVKVWRKVKVPGHVDTVLSHAKLLLASPQ